MNKDDADLTPEERRALEAWGPASPPAGFAARVSAEHARRAAAAPGPSPRERDRRRGRPRRAVTAAILAGVGALGLVAAAATATVRAAGDVGARSIYAAALVFGGILVVAGLFHGHGDHAGIDHDGDGAGAHDAADASHASRSGMSLLLGLRFWTFALAFFGLAGVTFSGLHLLGALPTALLSLAIGLGAGYVAASTLRRLAGSSLGRLAGAASLIGREAVVLLPVGKGRRGKIRLVSAAGSVIDALAETDGDEELGARTVVLIVGVRDTYVMVEKSPAPRAADGAASTSDLGGPTSNEEEP